MGDVSFEIWFPVDPTVFGIFLGVLLVMFGIWVYKFIASMLVGG